MLFAVQPYHVSLPVYLFVSHAPRHGVPVTAHDAALERTNAKFISRFQEMEKLAADKGISLADQPLPLLDELWNTAKQRLKDKA